MAALRSLYLILFIYCVFLAHHAHAACISAGYVDSYASLPPAPVFPTQTLAGALTPTPTTANPLTTGHWSETANLAKYRPPKITPVANPPRSGCPYLQPGLQNWHNDSIWSKVPANGQPVTLPANTKVLVSSCSIDPSWGKHTNI